MEKSGGGADRPLHLARRHSLHRLFQTREAAQPVRSIRAGAGNGESPPPDPLSILAFALPATAQVSVEYQLHIVTPFPGGSSGEAYVWDVNDDGTAVGTATSSTYHGFFWTVDDGKIDLCPGDVRGVNNAGVGVGNAIQWSGPTSSAVIPAPSSDYFTVHALDVSNMNYVVGEAVHQYSSSTSDQTAFVWDPINGTRDLRVLGVTSAFTAHAVNDSGQIVGDTSFTGSTSTTGVFMFDLVTNQTVALGSLIPGVVGRASARDINSSGMVTGYSGTPQLFVGDHAFVWTGAGGMQDIGVLGVYSGGITLEDSHAYAISDSGSVVGNSTVSGAATSWDARHAFIWDDTLGMRDLNELCVRPNDYYLINATAISNTGWICGTGFGSAGGGIFSGFVLEPILVNEPTFRRGDCNDDGSINIGDPIVLLSALFSGGALLPCDDACELNDDGALNIADAIYALNALFGGGPAPASPHPDCGVDRSPDALDCVTFTGCP